MEFAGMNYMAVIVAAIAGYAFGSVYYMTLAKPWMAAARLTKEDVKPAPLPFIIAFVAQLVMAYILAGLIGHVGSHDIGGGILSAVFVWLGFVVTSMLVNHQFQGQKPMLTVIDSAHWLGVMVIMGAVIGWFGA
jgi:hypothetical protein